MNNTNLETGISAPQLKKDNDIMREALQSIAKWELPETGEFWDREEKKPMGYEAAYGSNGVRDYIRELANKALENITKEKTDK